MYSLVDFMNCHKKAVWILWHNWHMLTWLTEHSEIILKMSFGVRIQFTHTYFVFILALHWDIISKSFIAMTRPPPHNDPPIKEGYRCKIEVNLTTKEICDFLPEFPMEIFFLDWLSCCQGHFKNGPHPKTLCTHPCPTHNAGNQGKGIFVSALA